MNLALIRLRAKDIEDMKAEVDAFVDDIRIVRSTECYPFAALNTLTGVLHILTHPGSDTEFDYHCRIARELNSVAALNKYFTEQVYLKAEHYHSELRKLMKEPLDTVNTATIREMARLLDLFHGYRNGREVNVTKDFLADNGTEDFTVGGIVQWDTFADEKDPEFLVYMHCVP